MFTHLTRQVFLTGVLSPPILVNGSDPIKTSEYNIQMNQEIDLNMFYMQGGPGASVANFKGKKINGSMLFFLRINQSNSLETGVKDIINSGQNYESIISLTTLLLPYNSNITAEGSPYTTSTNNFVFDTCLVKSVTISAKDNSDVEVRAEILGQNDGENITPLPDPQDGYSLYRKLNWYDCQFYNNGSQLETLKEFELKIEKDIDQKYFLFPYSAPTRYDRPYSSGVKSVTVSFKYVEQVTNIFDVFSYSIGGYDMSSGLSGNFGPISFTIPDVLLRISTQSLPSGQILRTTEGFYQMNPLTPATNNFLLNVP